METPDGRNGTRWPSLLGYGPLPLVMEYLQVPLRSGNQPTNPWPVSNAWTEKSRLEMWLVWHLPMLGVACQVALWRKSRYDSACRPSWVNDCKWWLIHIWQQFRTCHWNTIYKWRSFPTRICDFLDDNFIPVCWESCSLEASALAISFKFGVSLLHCWRCQQRIDKPRFLNSQESGSIYIYIFTWYPLVN